MARLGRGQPVPPVIRRSSLVDSTPPGTDYPLRPTVVVGPNARDLARRRTWRAPLVSRGSPLAAGIPWTFPATALPVTVEMAPGADPADDPDDWPWVDITQYVMARSDKVAVRITRGAQSPNSPAPVARCSFELNNRDGRFSTRNALGPYYPDLVLGTPLRVSITISGTTYRRFTGRLDDLPVRWDLSGTDCWVPATASGMMRRLGVGAVSLGPATTAAVSGDPDLMGYWPCGDVATATSAAEATGGPALVPTGTVTFAAVVGPDGTGMVPSVAAGGALAGAPRPAASGSAWTAETSVRVGIDVSGTVYPLTVGTPSGTWRISYANDPTTAVVFTDTTGTSGTSTTVITTSTHLCTDGWHTLSLRAAQSGADVGVSLYVDGTLVGSGTKTTLTNSAITSIQVGDGRASTGLQAVARVRTYDTAAPSTAAAAAAADMGFDAETTVDRFVRLCEAQGVPYEVMGTTRNTMGAQPDADFLALLRECETAEGGNLVETASGRMGLYAASVRANAAVALTLDASAGELAYPHEPTEDDAVTVNDSTASSTTGGLTAHAENTTHKARYQEYKKTLSVNVPDRAQLYAAASLQVWLGTYDLDYRYPQVRVDLLRNPHLAATAAALDVSSRIQITDRPLPEQPVIDVLAEGLAEELGAFWWRQTWTCTPFQRWDVGLLVDSGGPTGSGYRYWAVPTTFVTAEALDTTETGVDVTAVPVLPTSAAEYPIRIRILGEDMTVTACSGAGPTQTLTVTRSTNGVVKTHASGATVEILTALVATV
jgi:hypothetical protein